MDCEYPVLYEKNHAGKIVVQRKGLYYHFYCRCVLPQDNIYRLIVVCNAERESLGILVPQEDSFVLNKKIPMKHIGEGNMTFTVTANREVPRGNFVPISPVEPFSYLSQLKKSFLIIRNNQLGINVEEKQQHMKCC